MRRRSILALLAAATALIPLALTQVRRPRAGDIVIDVREPQILTELNLLRSDPANYATRLSSRRRHFQGNVLRLPGQTPLKTVEGITALNEAVDELRALRPLPSLSPSRALSRAAEDHVRDIGPKGLVSHEGRNGSSPASRVERYATRLGGVGEVISFGPEEAAAVIMDLIVDDGVPGRGHRKILLDGRLKLAGAACGPHAVYRTVCVIDLADELEEKRD